MIAGSVHVARGHQLIRAARAGHRDIVSLLLGRGADVNKTVYYLALTAAVEAGHKDVVSLLLDRGADVNKKVHYPALTAAAMAGHKDVVSLLLDRGADVNKSVNYPALTAAAKAGHKDVVSLLLDRGADVNESVNNTTALIEAVKAGHKDVVSLLLDRGANVDKSVNNTTALIESVKAGHKDVVSLLLDRGADVNLSTYYTTALIEAVKAGHKDVVSVLLDRGTDMNESVNYTTALIEAAKAGYQDVVSLLLGRGANGGETLVVAVRKGYKDLVSLLLDMGVDMNMVVHGHNDTTSALIAAIATYTDHEKGHTSVDMVRLLLDRGVDLNIIAGKYGTALTTAICVCHDYPVSKKRKRMITDPPAIAMEQLQPVLLSTLLNHNPDVSIVAGVYGTALIAAISKLQFPEQANRNQRGTVQSSGWQWVFINRLLSSKYLTQDHINVAVGEHGTPLAVAIPKGNLQLVRLLVEKGGDVSRAGDSCGIALKAALATGWDSQRLYDILQYLVGKGADINVVSSQQFGSALGQAAYLGDKGLVSFLLGTCEADPFHVGGTHYRAALGGAYPNALDAAQSPGSKAQPGLVGMLADTMKCSRKCRELQRSPPFPMPYTRSSVMPAHGLMATAIADPEDSGSFTSSPEGICGLPAYAALSAQHANIPCTALKEELIVKALVQLVIGIDTDTDTDAPELKCYEDWIRNDVRYFVTQGYDFGEAYAAARVGWRHFNKPDFVHLVEQHRGQWLRSAQEIDTERANSIHRDDMEQEMIKMPYKVMPRRLWDLKSNRVVEFRMLQSELFAYKCTMEQQFGKARAYSSEIPVFWAISHSWERSTDSVETPINQYQWRVPLPHELNLERDVRQELLSYRIQYVWLDVLCLRQHSATNLSPLNSQIAESAALNEVRNEEWKLDVPTIGNIYRVARGIVRYFNGLGRPFSAKGWDDERHWLQRAWTLQEIKADNSTINGGIHRGSMGSTFNIMNAYGKMAGRYMTLRSAIQPVLKLAADVDSSSGCSLYALVREMSRRKSTKSTDKVAGLVYLLRLTQLPTYDEKAKDNDVWARCFHMLPLPRKLELLFDFPYRSEQHPQWFPTWSELMAWPAVNPGCDYRPAVRMRGHRHLKIQGLADITESEGAAAEGSLFLSDIWALSHCNITCSSAQPSLAQSFTSVKPGGVNYNVNVMWGNINKVYGFYSPYVSQKLIETTCQQCEFTIVTTDLGHSNNWVVCQVVKRQKARCNSTPCSCELGPELETYESEETLEQSSEVEIEVLRKVGVLRTDFCGEILAGVDDDSALRRIHALFV